MIMQKFFQCLLLCVFLWNGGHAYGGTFSMRMIHKFSEESRSIMQGRNGDEPVGWHMKGTPEYYGDLLRHDRLRHASRGLLDSTASSSSVSLAPSNETDINSNYGGLHYGYVTLGTPNVSFLVALDTGSDLLWLPCDCKQCAPASSPSSSSSVDYNLPVYSPSESNTSKVVSCNDKLCSSSLSPSCTGTNQCNYLLSYGAANTTTSGSLVEDTLYLDSETGGLISTSVPFGCSQVQTGIFLQGVAPDGLLGLGRDAISLPSTLARSKLVPDSFSMCFSNLDGSGRLVFGDKGQAGIQSTSLQQTQQNSYYYVLGVEGASVNNGSTVAVSLSALFDTGTAITRLMSPAYQTVTAAIIKQIDLPEINDSSIGFDYCWQVSDSKSLDQLPTLSIVFSGGRNLTVADPYVQLVNQYGSVVGVCLAILEDSTSIIGHNFMGGYRFIFDREEMALGWAASNCYDLNGVASEYGPQAAPSATTGGSSPNVTTRDSTQNQNSAAQSILPPLFSILLLPFTFAIVYIFRI